MNNNEQTLTFPIIFTKKQVLFDKTSNNAETIIKDLGDTPYSIINISIPITQNILNIDSYLPLECKKPKWLTDEIVKLNLQKTIPMWQISHIVRQGSSNCNNNQFKIYIKDSYCNELQDNATAIFLHTSHCIKQTGGTAYYYNETYSKKLKKGTAKFFNNSENINQCGGTSEHYDKSKSSGATNGNLKFLNESINDSFKGNEQSLAILTNSSTNKQQKNGTTKLYGSSVNLEMHGGEAFMYEQSINKNQKNGTVFLFNNITSINKLGGTCYKIKP